MEDTGGGDSAGVDALPIGHALRKRTTSVGTPAPRHYPLDLPHTPFHRYEHRLTARDIMVHRIMSDLMNPSRVAPKTYDAHVVHPAAFNPISSQDTELGADLRCLQKMLFTSFADTPPPRNSPLTAMVPSAHAQCCGIRETRINVEGPRNKPPLLNEQVLDLVRRHYFEVDNTMFRAWISHLGPVPTPSSGPRTHTGPRSWGYSIALPRPCLYPELLFRANTGRFHPRGYGHWTAKDTSHLQSLRDKVAVQTKLPLYDGGIFMPPLRWIFDHRAGGGTRRGPGDNKWVANLNHAAIGSTASFPEECRTMRFILQPVWEDRRSGLDILLMQQFWALDLDLNPGRGRNRDGIWSTGQHPTWGENGDYEGRYARVRRRCTSLPPPGSFTAAYIGAQDKQPPTSKVQLIFPRMTLAQMDRRSRRRSVSRTRIAEMFDWDIDLMGTGVTSPKERIKFRPNCENCAGLDHFTSDCAAPCGHCGAPNPTPLPSSSSNQIFKLDPNIYASDEEDDQPLDYEARPGRHQRPHLAPECPVARHNRCKCLPFPTFHVAARCGITCHRDCGGEGAPGSFRHRNAMLCRSRCCMCGIRGHSGKECRSRRCRCGESHLGQDCGWNPTCRVDGCSRFWCGIHCRDCGSTEKPFVSWLCAKCSPVPASAALAAEEPRGRRRRHKRATGVVDMGMERKGDEVGVSGAVERGVGGDEATTPPRLRTGSISTLFSPQTDNPTPQTLFGGPRVLKDDREK